VEGVVTETARVVGTQFAILVGFGVVVLVGIVIVMVVFVVKYHRSRHPVAADISGSPVLELIWITIPTLIVLGMFAFGLRGYLFLRQPPAGAMEVKVEAFEYGWEFEYANGATDRELRVPAGRPVVLRLTSRDVVHSFFVPDFRIKQDTVPGLTTTMWFQADEPGEHDALCAEYCGVGHSDMMTKVIVLEAGVFDAWYAEAAPGAAD
jgi:cytochrome c oxidase subunit 2